MLYIRQKEDWKIFDVYKIGKRFYSEREVDLHGRKTEIREEKIMQCLVRREERWMGIA